MNILCLFAFVAQIKAILYLTFYLTGKNNPEGISSVSTAEMPWESRNL